MHVYVLLDISSVAKHTLADHQAGPAHYATVVRLSSLAICKTTRRVICPLPFPLCHLHYSFMALMAFYLREFPITTHCVGSGWTISREGG